MQPDPTACAGVPKGRRVLLFSSTGPLSRLKVLLGKAKEVACLVEGASGWGHRPQGPRRGEFNKVGLVKTTTLQLMENI